MKRVQFALVFAGICLLQLVLSSCSSDDPSCVEEEVSGREPVVMAHRGSHVPQDFSCLGQDAQAVDWFILYKLPQHTGGEEDTGIKFLYMDNNNSSWSLSEVDITEETQALAHTLHQVYHTQQEEMFYGFYNDQPPDGKTSSTYGHAKGALAAQGSSGFWLISSLPRFPQTYEDGRREYEYPHSGAHYGQTMMCISLSLDELDKAASMLKYNRPKFYDHFMSTELQDSLPGLSELITAHHDLVTEEPWTTQVQVKSLAGKTFIAFGKDRKFYEDLYDSLVAPSLQDNLLVETWRYEMTSSCQDDFQVHNVGQLNFLGFSFNSHVDHAKWTVAEDKQYVCIGDINRSCPQEHRGGGTVCINNADVHQAFKDGVTEIQACPMTPTVCNND